MVDQLLHVEIEPTNICNTRCLHCPHEALSRPYGKMDWETYQVVMERVKAYTGNFSVEYAGMGEPLLNPLIYQFIESVPANLTTSLTTNASALTEKNLRRLVEAGLHRLTISFNGSEKELYELMMGNLSFERAEEHLRSAIAATSGTRTQVAVNVSVTRQTQAKLAEIQAYLQQVGVNDIFFSKCHSRGGFLKSPLICTTPQPPVDPYRCDIFTSTLFVAWTGEVLSCCHDLAGANVIGNLKTEPLATIFERKGQIAAEGVKFEICRNCNDLYRFMNDQTPDQKPIPEWVYALYNDEDRPDLPQVSSLSEWLYALYIQEDQPRRLFRRLTTQIVEKDAFVRSLSAENSQQAERLSVQQQELQALQAELQALRNSRSWRLLEQLHRLRRFLVPIGSQREQLFERVLERFDKGGKDAPGAPELTT